MFAGILFGGCPQGQTGLNGFGREHQAGPLNTVTYIGRLLGAGIAQQHYELIPAEPHYYIFRSTIRLQNPGRVNQKPITGRVAKGIVDQFKAIYIAYNYAYGQTTGNIKVFQFTIQIGAVEAPGKRIVFFQIIYRIFRPFAVINIPPNALKTDNAGAVTK
jgi:hypothetical protein